MEFLYFYELNRLRPEKLGAHWDLEGTPSGEFDGTSELEWPTYGSEVNPKNFTILSSIRSDPGNHILFSTFSDDSLSGDAPSGWTLGINDAQKLYLQIAGAPAYCFDSNIAPKNALAFVKAGDRYSLAVYDFISKEANFEDVLIKGTPDSNNSFYLGGNDLYESLYPTDYKLSGDVDLFVYVSEALYESKIVDLFEGFRMWTNFPPTSEDFAYLDGFRADVVKVQNHDKLGDIELTLYDQSLIPLWMNNRASYSPVNDRFLTTSQETGVYSNVSGDEEFNDVSARIIDRVISKGSLVHYDSSARDSVSPLGVSSGDSLATGEYFLGSSEVRESGQPDRFFFDRDYREMSSNHENPLTPINSLIADNLLFRVP